MNRIHQSCIAAALIFSLVSTSYSNSHSVVIIGLDNAKHYHGSASKKYFIQAGAFSIEKNALAYQQSIQSRISAPVHINDLGRLKRVMIGPLASAAEVRETARMLDGSGKTHHRHHAAQKPVVHKPAPKPPVILKEKEVTGTVDKDGFLMAPVASGWFAGVYAGPAWGSHRTMFVDNNSDASAPFNLDTFTVNQVENPQGMLGVSAGYRWMREAQWMPVASLNFRYHHLFAHDVFGNVIPFSEPEFTNYTYGVDLSSNSYMAAGKLDLLRFNSLLPYVSGGIGVAYNKMNNYFEQPFPGVFPRESPAFAGGVNREFTWSLGFGLDYQFSPRTTVSAGYEYQSYGRFMSGFGVDAWGNRQLIQHSFYTNSLLLSMDYVFAD